MYPWDKDIGEENPHKGSDGWTSTDCIFMMQRVEGSQGVHQPCRAHILYAIEAMEPTVFNWVEALLLIFKDQLTKCW